MGPRADSSPRYTQWTKLNGNFAAKSRFASKADEQRPGRERRENL